MIPMGLSRSYLAAVVSKLCYGIFLVNLKKTMLDWLGQMHIDVAKICRVGTAIVALSAKM